MPNPERIPTSENYYSKEERRAIIAEAANISVFGAGHVHECRSALLVLLNSYLSLDEGDQVRFVQREDMLLYASHIWHLLRAIPD